MCGPRQLFIFWCSSENPEGWRILESCVEIFSPQDCTDYLSLTCPWPSGYSILGRVDGHTTEETIISCLMVTESPRPFSGVNTAFVLFSYLLFVLLLPDNPSPPPPAPPPLIFLLSKLPLYTPLGYLIGILKYASSPRMLEFTRNILKVVSPKEESERGKLQSKE